MASFTPYRSTGRRPPKARAPRILMTLKPGRMPGIGDHVLSRIEPVSAPQEDGFDYTAVPIKILPRERTRQLGIFRKLKDGGIIEPTEKKQLREWRIGPGETEGAADGELVRFEVTKTGRTLAPRARIIERLGHPEGERAISMIAIENHSLPNVFPQAIDAEVAALKSPTLKGREDLRKIPLLTIDPADAKDHDDAVWAAPDDDKRNQGGFVVMVAIADVAFYVRPGTALDREALKRGNSVYFPDQVVPMLPEALSNDLCSLKESVDRPCLAVRMVFDAHGRKLDHRFMRGMMRSPAKFSYPEAQAAIDGHPSEKTKPLLEPVLKPLWAAYKALHQARQKRGPLELDLPERKIILDDLGRVARIVTPERLDAHRLIEEFMIQANVAAAETLEAMKSPLLYRIHDAPAEEKVVALTQFLATLGIDMPKAGLMQPSQFNRILDRTKDGEFSELVNEVILRSQAQAEYSANNLGHFGLNLRRYAHFTSPIRRYADLIVHRGLIRALKLGPGGLADAEMAELDQTAEQISQAERRAMAAERETVDRLIATHLATHIGASFSGRISGVTRSGLFVKLNDNGADGFIPASTDRPRLLCLLRRRPRTDRRAHRRDLPAGRQGRSEAGRGAPLSRRATFPAAERWAFRSETRPAQARYDGLENTPAQALNGHAHQIGPECIPFDFHPFGTIFLACTRSNRQSALETRRRSRNAAFFRRCAEARCCAAPHVAKDGFSGAI